MPSASTKRQARVLVATAVLGPMAFWAPDVVEAVRGLDTFAVRDVEVTGVKILTEDEVIQRLALDSYTSVWGDTELWQERVAADPMVRTATIHRRVPHGLLVEVVEREPVALAATPLLEPVDADGYRLPIDPTLYRLDLPIIDSDRRVPDDAALFPEDVRALAAEVEHLMATHQDFAHRISTIRWYAPGVVAARLQSPAVDFIMPARTTGARIREGESALGHAMQGGPARAPSEVDLRFTGQVVVRHADRYASASFNRAGSR